MSETGQTPAGEGTPPAAGQAPASSWKDAVPEEYRAVTEKYETIGDFAKAHKEIRTKISDMGKGQDAIALPREGADQGEWDRFYKSIGRPDAAEGYDYALDDNNRAYADYINSLKNEAYVAGLTGKQAKAFIDAALKGRQLGIDSVKEKQTVTADQTIAALKSEWGEAYETKVRRAKNAYGKFAATDGDKADLAAFENNAAFIRMMDNIAMHVGEDTIMSDARQGDGESIPQLRARAREIMADKAYKNVMDPRHDVLIAEKNAIYEKIGKLSAA